MHILLFTEIYDCGGIDTFISNLVNNWPNSSDEFTLIANKNYPGLEIIQKKVKRKITIKRHSIVPFESPELMEGLRGTCKKILLPFIKYIYFFYYIIALKKWVIKPFYDCLIVINGGYPGGDTCRAAAITWGTFNRHKLQSIHNFHNLVVPASMLYSLQETIIDRWVVKNTSKFVTVSKAAAESISQRRYILGKCNVEYIYNGIDQSFGEFTSIDIKKELNISSTSPVCMILATYEKRKGHLFLLQSFKLVLNSVPDAVLLMFGFGYTDEIKIVEDEIDRLKLRNNVYLNGFRNDVYSLYKSCDILLITSQEYESFGLTAIEAMAHCIPIVATNVGGIPEVIKDGVGGFCIDKTDIHAFSEKIVLLLNNYEYRKTIGLKGEKRFKECFTAEKMSKHYLELIRKLESR
jgi:glycosyltransferase involved in cell wall biosynthesis